MGEITSCPSCKVQLQLPESDLGLDVKCTQCGQVFRAGSAIQVKPEKYPASYRQGSPPQPFGRLEDAEDYRPVRGPLAGLGRARAAIIMLIVCMVFEGIGIAIDFLDIQGIHIMMGFGPFEGKTLARLIYLPSLAVGIGTAVVFLMWLYSAYGNLEGFGVKGLENSPVSAVGGFFVPIFNLLGPLYVVQEIWKASDPRVRDSWKEGSASALAAFWWTCWILGNILGVISALMVTRAENFELNGHPVNTLAEINSFITLHIVSRLLTITGGILVIFLIKGIMRRQTEKFERLVSRSEPE